MKLNAWMAVCAGLTITLPALAGGGAETEPNDTKAAANLFVLSVGDAVTGTTTGASTTVAGVGSADNFRIATPGAPLGIYRYTMTLTSAIPGHTASIRGLTQTAAGVITAGTDAIVQTSITQADTSRLIAWYGFGLQEQVIYRVAGAVSTTAPYSAALARTTVTPTTLPTALAPGQYTIRVTAAGSTPDTELWIYNRSTMQPIADWGNDDTPATAVGGTGVFSTLTRTFPVGAYLMAVGDYNLANNLASPSDDNFRQGEVMDFPNVVANLDNEGAWTATVVFNVGANINGADAATITLPASSVPFEIKWLSFNIGSPCAPDIGIQGGVAGQDGHLDNNDFIVFINYFFNNDAHADVGRQGGVAPGDGLFDNNDFIVYINLFFGGC